MDDLATALKKARLQANLTMEVVAQKFGISRSAISQWEDPSIKARPTLDKLPALADLYGVDLRHLLNGDVVPVTRQDKISDPTQRMPSGSEESGNDDLRHGFATRLNLALDAIGFPPKGKGRQDALGKRMGVSQKGARKWLVGESMPTEEHRRKLVDLCRVSYEWLFSGTGPKEPPSALGEPPRLGSPTGVVAWDNVVPKYRMSFSMGGGNINNLGVCLLHYNGYRFGGMSTFSQRVKRARQRAGLTQEKLSELVGISQPAIQKLERNAETSRYLVQIARACGVRPEWLQSGEGEMLAHPYAEPASLGSPTGVLAWDNADSLPDVICVVPKYRMSFSMGEGKVMFEVQEDEAGIAFRARWLAKKGLKPGSCFVAKVEGTSMEPKLEEGESVLVDRTQTTIIDRKIYAVCYDGKIYCKRLFKAGNEIIMRSDNPAYPEIRAKVEEVEIIGRIVWHSGEL